MHLIYHPYANFTSKILTLLLVLILQFNLTKSFAQSLDGSSKSISDVQLKEKGQNWELIELNRKEPSLQKAVELTAKHLSREQIRKEEKKKREALILRQIESRLLSHQLVSEQEFRKKLLRHDKWTQSGLPVFEQALLASDDPRWSETTGRLVLENAFLFKAKLQNQNLQYANLRGALLMSADLRGADLTGANLEGADLSFAELDNAKLIGANLKDAKLFFANARSAFLNQVDLRGARIRDINLEDASLGNIDGRGILMYKAKLARANLIQAKLEKAQFLYSDLTDVLLRDADLEGAEFVRTNLEGANLTNAILLAVTLNGTRLGRAIFEPQVGMYPDDNAFLSVHPEGLEQLRYEKRPEGLVKMRAVYRNAGYRERERQLTFAIKRSEYDALKNNGHWIKAELQWLLFDCPVAYGLYPGRALKWLICLIVLFGLYYSYAFARPNAQKSFGIWRVWPNDRTPLPSDRSESELIKKTSIPWALGLGFYFSLLSAFHIGWRDFSVGSWLSRLQPIGYAMTPTGWVRVFSGIQSLFSVYLLAMWFLFYFGRPFQ